MYTHMDICIYTYVCACGYIYIYTYRGTCMYNHSGKVMPLSDPYYTASFLLHFVFCSVPTTATIATPFLPSLFVAQFVSNLLCLEIQSLLRHIIAVIAEGQMHSASSFSQRDAASPAFSACRFELRFSRVHPS